DPGFAATQLARDTAADPDARKYFKPLIERIENVPHAYGEDPDLARCAQRCLDLASGRYDALSGGYFELPDDPDALLAEKRAAVACARISSCGRRNGRPLRPAVSARTRPPKRLRTAAAVRTRDAASPLPPRGRNARLRRPRQAPAAAAPLRRHPPGRVSTAARSGCCSAGSSPAVRHRSRVAGRPLPTPGTTTRSAAGQALAGEHASASPCGGPPAKPAPDAGQDRSGDRAQARDRRSVRVVLELVASQGDDVHQVGGAGDTE